MRVEVFEQVIFEISGGNKKLKTSEYSNEGLFPIIDQGQELISGYHSSEDYLIKSDPPFIIFGDHTRVFKYIDFKFTLGADGVKVLKVKEDQLFPKYAYYFFNHLNIPNTGYNRHFKYLKESKIPLPPLSEQKRIAELLDAADSLRKKDKALLEKYDQLAQSLFLEMFGDPFDANNNINKVSFASLTNRITYGFTKPMKHLESGIPILTAKNIQSGYIDFEKIHYADINEYNELTAKNKPGRNDILITKDGSIGRTALFKENFEVCINQSVALIKPKLEIVSPQFLVSYLNSTVVQNKIQAMGKGGGIKHLQITELAKFPTFFPSMDVQTQFAEQVQLIERQKEIAKKNLEKSEELMKGLMGEVFG